VVGTQPQPQPLSDNICAQDKVAASVTPPLGDNQPAQAQVATVPQLSQLQTRGGQTVDAAITAATSSVKGEGLAQQQQQQQQQEERRQGRWDAGSGGDGGSDQAGPSKRLHAPYTYLDAWLCLCMQVALFHCGVSCQVFLNVKPGTPASICAARTSHVSCQELMHAFFHKNYTLVAHM
jgi:hypothetical protein